MYSLPAVFGEKHGLQKKACKVAVVCNVYDYFERESKKNKKIHQGIVKLKKKTVDATRLSRCNVDVNLAEKCSLGDGKFESDVFEFSFCRYVKYLCLSKGAYCQFR